MGIIHSTACIGSFCFNISLFYYIPIRMKRKSISYTATSSTSSVAPLNNDALSLKRHKTMTPYAVVGLSAVDCRDQSICAICRHPFPVGASPPHISSVATEDGEYFVASHLPMPSIAHCSKDYCRSSAAQSIVQYLADMGYIRLPSPIRDIGVIRSSEPRTLDPNWQIGAWRFSSDGEPFFCVLQHITRQRKFVNVFELLLHNPKLSRLHIPLHFPFGFPAQERRRITEIFESSICSWIEQIRAIVYSYL